MRGSTRAEAERPLLGQFTTPWLAGKPQPLAREVVLPPALRENVQTTLMLADDAHEAAARADKAAPQSDSLRAAVALAESREAAAKDELRDAQARERALRAELDAARAAPGSTASAASHRIVWRQKRS